MAELVLPLLFGTVRKENFSRTVAEFVLARGAARPGVETRLFDPATLPFGNLEAREWEMDSQPPEVAAFVAEMERSDGFVIVTPEYNRGIPGALKNMIDHLYSEWSRKPFALVGVSNGFVGGARAVDHLTTVLPGVEAFAVPYSVLVREVPKSFPRGGPPRDEAEMTSRVDRLWSELEWYARALKPARAHPPVPRSPKPTRARPIK